MIRGIYTAASGLGVAQARLEVLANNLANATTPGFKADRLVQEPFWPHLLAAREEGDFTRGALPWRPVGYSYQGVMVREVRTDFSPGPLKETGRRTDIALGRPGAFLAVETPQGERYTRDGSLGVDAQGYLVDSRGHRVLGEGGYLQVGSGDFKINPNGEVFAADGRPVGRLRVVEFADPALLEKAGDGYFAAPPGEAQPAANPEVHQGFLEGSNTDPAASAVGIMQAVRAYGANQRLLQAHDHLLELAVNRVGEVR
ncbi:flagellar hook-basal body protein [Desulfovirgula thermocuniculi]|uniref:flagellar hook-basal body protein n=1 Tax=Desulfovirgula thermocuniculi TaxID=348842 RepID=UPI000400AAC5|nr:flagellar hook-basal body protein [Desulfovirgula thermocuniculi]